MELRYLVTRVYGFNGGVILIKKGGAFVLDCVEETGASCGHAQMLTNLNFCPN